MPITDLDEFASTGTKTEPPADDKADGWVPGEQVTGAHHNWWQNQITNKINEVIREGMDTVYPGTDPQGVIATKLWGVTNESWAFTDDAQNYVDGGGTKNYRNLQCYFTPSTMSDPGKIRLAAMHYGADTSTIDVYDPRATPPAAASGESASAADLLAGLDTTGSQVWTALAMCTDGTTFYVMFVDTNAAPDVYVVQAYDIDGWGVKSGWPATGRSLPGSGALNATYSIPDIIVASGTYLATNNPWNQTGSSNSVSTLLITDGTVASGDGDAPSVGSEIPAGTICSDGTYLYFGVSDPGANHTMCSAALSNLATSAASTPFTLTAGYVRHTCHLGGGVIAWLPYTDTTNVVIFGDSTDMDLDFLQYGSEDALTVTPDGRWLNEYKDGGLVFDGLNLWIRGHAENDTGSSPTVGYHIALKFNVSQLFLDSSTPSAAVTDLNLIDHTEIYMLRPRAEMAGAGEAKFGRMAFDGRDVWAVLDHSSDGKIYRVPRANR